MERQAPFSEEAERGLLGSILLEDSRVLPMAVTQYGLKPEAFYVSANRLIAEAMWALGAENRSADLVTVGQVLRDHGRYDEAGGEQALARLVDDTPSAANAEFYCQIVRDKWWLRQMIAGAREIERQAYEPQESVESFVRAAPDALMRIIEAPEAEADNSAVMVKQIDRWADAKAAREGDLTRQLAIGYETPWRLLTELTCGLEPGLMIIAGRPSAGKTTLEDVLAVHVAGLGIPVGRISLDKSKASLLSRAICRTAGVSLPKLKQGFARESQLAACREAEAQLRELPMEIRSDLRDVAAIRMWAMAQHRKGRLGMLTIDYVQQVSAAALGWQATQALAKTTYVIGQLKALGLELGIPILVLSQLSRSGEQEGRGDPRLSDLRDSGALEQDAEKVLFLFVDKKKRKEMDEAVLGATKHKRPVWFRLEKNKDGEMGSVRMWMLPPYFNFVKAEDDWADDGVTEEQEWEDVGKGDVGCGKKAESGSKEEQREFGVAE